jgi:hypothetical protein
VALAGIAGGLVCQGSDDGNPMYVLAEMDNGALAVGRVADQRDKYVMYLVNVEKGRILESSKYLTEAELREILTESYGESDADIEHRIALAKAHPYAPPTKAMVTQHVPPKGTTTSRTPRAVKKVPRSWWAALFEKIRNF